MKKISVLFVMMFLLVGLLSFVVAEEDISEETDIPEAGKVGFFGNAADAIRFAFTFNKEKKIEIALDRAEKRLAEAEVEEYPEKIEKAQEKYDAFVAKAEEILANIEVRRDDENGSVDYLGQIARIENRFELHREHADEIYTRALARFETNNASDEKIERFEMFYERALNRSDRMEARLIAKRDRAEVRYKSLSGKSEIEFRESIEGIDSAEGLTAARERRELRADVRIEKLDGIKIRIIARYESRLEGSDLSDEQREEIRIRIETADGRRLEFRQRIRDGEVRTRIRIEDKDDSDEDDDSSDEDDDSDEDENETEDDSTIVASN